MYAEPLQTCDRLKHWSVQRQSRPAAIGQENCNCCLLACYESDRCLDDVALQARNGRRSGRHEMSLYSSSQPCCVASLDRNSTVNSEHLTTAYDLRSHVHHVSSDDSGKCDFGKKLRSKEVDASDTNSQSLCDTRVAETTTSGLNDFRLPLRVENATSCAELETVEEREVEGRSDNGVVFGDEIARARMIDFVMSGCKHVPEATEQLPA